MIKVTNNISWAKMTCSIQLIWPILYYEKQALILLAFSQLALAGEINLVDKQSGKVVATISQNDETEFLIRR